MQLAIQEKNLIMKKFHFMQGFPANTKDLLNIKTLDMCFYDFHLENKLVKLVENTNENITILQI